MPSQEEFSDEIAFLSDLRDQMEELRAAGNWPVAKVVAERDAAEARAAAYEQALREIAAMEPSTRAPHWKHWREIAREALAAAEETRETQ